MSNKLTLKGVSFGSALALTLAGLVGIAAPASAVANPMTVEPIAGSTFKSLAQSGVTVLATLPSSAEDLYLDDEDMEFVIESDNIDEVYADLQAGRLQVEVSFHSEDDGFWNTTDNLEGVRYQGDNSTSGNDFYLGEDTDRMAGPSSEDDESYDYFLTTDGDGNPYIQFDGDEDTAGNYWNVDDDEDGAQMVVSFVKPGNTSTSSEFDVTFLVGGDPFSPTTTISLIDDRSAAAAGTTTITRTAAGEPMGLEFTFNDPTINTWMVQEWGFSARVAATGYNWFSSNPDRNRVLDAEADYYTGGFAEEDVAFEAPYSIDVERKVSFSSNPANQAFKYNYPLVIQDWYYDVPPVELPALATGQISETYYAKSWLYRTGDPYDNSSASLFDYDLSGDTDYQYTRSSAIRQNDFLSWLSPVSGASSVTAGGSALASGIYPFVTATKDLVAVEDDFEQGDYLAIARAKSTTHTVSAQITMPDGQDSNNLPDNLPNSNVQVRAYVYAENLVNPRGEISFVGSTETIGEGEDVVLTARTNSLGQVSFTMTNSSADFDDVVSVYFEVLQRNGTWAGAADDLEIEWVTTALDDFSVSDEAISGENISLTYEAYDQFGQPLSAIAAGAGNALSVTLTGTDGSALLKSNLNQKKALVNGVATFTFANYATVGSFNSVVGVLHTNNVLDSALTSSSGANVLDSASTRVYRNSATTELSGVDELYGNRVVYAEFRAGTYSTRTVDAAFKKFIDEKGVLGSSASALDGDFADIVGTVLTATGNGAALQDVAISGAGLYFAVENGSRTTYSVDTATVKTDVAGNFKVRVWSHKENLTGLNVSLTSGGKSFATKLVTVMSTDIDAGEYFGAGSTRSSGIDAAVVTSDWNRVTGGAPALGTIYELTYTARDVWGNILRGAVIEVDADTDNLVSVVSGEVNNGEEGSIYISSDSNGQIKVKTRAGEEERFPLRTGAMETTFTIYEYDYSTGIAALDAVAAFFTTSFDDLNAGVRNVDASFVGTQASAKAGKNAGVVRVTVDNAKGKTVKVFVAGKLKKTVVADKIKFATRVKGIKAGEKRVTVKIGKTRAYTGFIAIK